MQHLPIFLSIDDNYTKFAATTIASICYHTSAMVDFYILSETGGGGISETHREHLRALSQRFPNFSLKFNNVDVQKILPNIDIIHSDWWSKEIYLKLLIPELEPTIDKAIYLDADTIVLDDIQKLYQEDLHGYALGAVIDGGQKLSRLQAQYYSSDLQIQHQYFNVGVLLFDCRQWREQHILTEIIDLLKQSHTKLEYPEQDLLNNYFSYNRYCRLPAKYNVIQEKIVVEGVQDLMQIPESEIQEAKQHPIIRHFCNMKPWKTNICAIHQHEGKNFHDFWFFAQMTEFYSGLQLTFLSNKLIEDLNKPKFSQISFKIFKIPLFKIVRTNQLIMVYLFRHIPIMKFTFK